MTDAKPSNVRDLYEQAARIKDDAARQTFLDEACGTEIELRQRVEQLLTARRSRSDNPLQRATADSMSGRSLLSWDGDDIGKTIDSHPDAMGDNSTCDDATRGRIDVSTHPMIGNYQLLEELGHGGMGTVYMAGQSKPVKRQVALKVIKPGMDSKEVIVRFEAERQALAMMDHPHIARVLDGGTTDEGRPYFVMELVRGVPITEFCKHKSLPLRQRLELFVDICHAVQHAHQKGIIHRDLKPSNIMVTLHDGKPVVKVIDFGVAKALHQDLTERTLFTHFSQMVGTPLYMAPEQAEMSGGLGVDTRSDIYSLGVVLYELLTGTTPFDRDTMSKLGIDGIRKMIQEQEPPRPSARISTLKAANCSTIEEQRQLDTDDIAKQLNREVDWIVMKALEKDRERRYETANAFAADIQRFLNDEPVEACPPSVGYRLQKYSKRHRVALTTSALVALSILVGFGATLWQLAEATQQRDRAIAAEHDAQQKAQLAQQEAERADEEAKRANREAEISKAVSAFLNEDLLAQADPANQPNPNIKLREVIDQAAEELESRFADQPLVEAAIRQTLAEAYDSLGDYKAAKQHADRAFELRSKHLDANDQATLTSALWSGWELRQLGKYRDAIRTLTPLHQTIKETTDRNNPLFVRASRLLVGAQESMGLFREAEVLANELVQQTRHAFGADDPITLRAEDALASVLRRNGKYIEAEQLHRDIVRKSRTSLGKEHPGTLSFLHNLAIDLKDLAKFEESERIHHEVLEIRQRVLGEDHPATLSSMLMLASVYGSTGRHSKAEELEKQVMERSRRILGEEHSLVQTAMHNLAVTCRRQYRFDEAEKLFSESLKICERTLGKSNPGTSQTKHQLAYLYGRTGRYKKAEKLLSEVVSVTSNTLGESHPIALGALSDLARANSSLGKYDEAEAHYKSVLEMRHRRLGSKHPNTIGAMVDVATLYQEQGRYREARSLHQRALDMRVKVLGKDHRQSILSLMLLANIESRLGNKEMAESLLKESLAHAKETLGEHDTVTLSVRNTLGALYIDLKRLDDAREMLNLAISGQEQVLGEEHPNTLVSLANLALLSQMQSRYEEAEQISEQILAIQLSALGPDHPETLRVSFNLGTMYLHLERFNDAESLIRTAYQSQLAHLGVSNPRLKQYEPNFVFVLKKLGKYEEAGKIQRRRIQVSTEEFGEETQEVINARDELAIIYREADQLNSWEETVRENLKLKRRVLGDVHEDTAYSRKQLRSVLMRRSETLVLAEEYDAALETLSEMRELSPDRRQLESLVALLMYNDEQELPAKVSRQLWERAQAEESGPFPTSRWIVDALLMPHHGLEPETLVAFMIPVLKSKNGHMPRLGLGLAHYRAGHFTEAADMIEAYDTDPTWTRPIAYFFSAMAHQKIEKTDRAKELYDLAVDRMNEITPTPESGIELKKWEPPRWALWCLYQGVQREAIGVLEIDIEQTSEPALSAE